MDLSPAALGQMLVMYPCLLFSLSFHEAAHALMANRCGDPTARLLGRATLNPLAHIDPIGTVVMPILMMLSGVPFLVGWAKPVPVNPRNFHDMRRDNALVAAAGPGSNLLLAFSSMLLLKVFVTLAVNFPDTQVFVLLFAITRYLVIINFLLALFNLIPVPPLDGSHILGPLLPAGAQRALDQLGPFGIIIAIIIARTVLPIPMRFLEDVVERFAFWGVG
ncbi:MAG: site-2 protease family protein [Nitrospiraceae bacterium]|nr:site-2 protease family protein [Nitrospiraceae bacterium]